MLTVARTLIADTRHMPLYPDQSGHSLHTAKGQTNILAGLPHEEVAEVRRDGDGADRAVDEQRALGPVPLHDLGVVLHAVHRVAPALNRRQEPVTG